MNDSQKRRWLGRGEIIACIIIALILFSLLFSQIQTAGSFHDREQELARNLVLFLLFYQERHGSFPFSDQGEHAALEICVNEFGHGRIDDGSEGQRLLPEADLRQWLYVNQPNDRDISYDRILAMAKRWFGKSDSKCALTLFADGSIRWQRSPNPPMREWLGCWAWNWELVFLEKDDQRRWSAIHSIDGIELDARFENPRHERLGLEYLYEYEDKVLSACIINGNGFRVRLRVPKDQYFRVIGIETSIEGDASAIPEELKAVLPER